MNEKGFALVTALLLGTMCIVLIAVAAHLVSTGTTTSGIQKRYQTEVQIASGAAAVARSQIMVGTLTCNATQVACVPNTAAVGCDNAARIYFSPATCAALDKPNCDTMAATNLTGCYLSEDIDPADPTSTLISIKITSVSEANETSIIDAVFKFQ